jgi:hypothetical protein
VHEFQLVRARVLEPDDIGAFRAVALTWTEPKPWESLRSRRVAHAGRIVLDHLHQVIPIEVTPEARHALGQEIASSQRVAEQNLIAVLYPTFRTLVAHDFVRRRRVAGLLAWTVDGGRY